MKRTPVESSNIKSVGYDTDNKVLEIEFHTGAVYQYMGVSKAIHKALMGAESKGWYFADYIKTLFPYEKVSG